MTSNATKMARRTSRRKARRQITLAGGEVATVSVPARDAPRDQPATMDAIDARLRRLGHEADKDFKDRIAVLQGQWDAVQHLGAKADIGQAIKAARQAHAANVADASLPWAGDDVGIAIMTREPRETWQDLWAAADHMRRTYAAYNRAIGAPSPHAQSLSIMLPPDSMETSANAPAFDDRPLDERFRSATTAWMAVQGWLGYVDNRARSAALSAVVYETGLKDWPGILAALMCVGDGISGRKIVWRGR